MQSAPVSLFEKNAVTKDTGSSPAKYSMAARVLAPEFLVPMILTHAVVLGVAPFLFSWSALAFAYAASMLFAYSMGIFHHMKLSHDSFEGNIWVTRIGALLGTLTWRGPMAAPLRYAAMHRLHHQFSDKENDPHSPIHGYWHSLIGWFWRIAPEFRAIDQYSKLAGKISEDPFLRFLDRNVNLLQLLWGLVAFLIGAGAPMLLGGEFDMVNGWRFLVYGVFVKTLMIVYLGGAVDLINHGVGYRNYSTSDRSTNSMLMGMFHLGGAISWHNNHHAHPGYFFVRKNWWELDAHYGMLLVLRNLGLVGSIKKLDEYTETQALNVSTLHR